MLFFLSNVTSDDNREKLQAMELFKDTHLVKLVYVCHFWLCRVHLRPHYHTLLTNQSEAHVLLLCSSFATRAGIIPSPSTFNTSNNLSFTFGSDSLLYRFTNLLLLNAIHQRTVTMLLQLALPVWKIWRLCQKNVSILMLIGIVCKRHHRMIETITLDLAMYRILHLLVEVLI